MELFREYGLFDLANTLRVWQSSRGYGQRKCALQSLTEGLLGEERAFGAPLAESPPNQAANWSIVLWVPPALGAASPARYSS